MSARRERLDCDPLARCSQPRGVATGLWPDGPNCRGWSLAPLVHLGDVIEFGADAAAVPCRWYGYVVHADDVSLTLVGPFDSPNDAADDGSDCSQPGRPPMPARCCGGPSPTEPD